MSMGRDAVGMDRWQGVAKLALCVAAKRMEVESWRGMAPVRRLNRQQ
jgi:hypothetical protein